VTVTFEVTVTLSLLKQQKRPPLVGSLLINLEWLLSCLAFASCPCGSWILNENPNKTDNNKGEQC
jgi:hypothetical protein